MKSNLKDCIFYRKSTRKYSMEKVGTELLGELQAFERELVPLYPDIKVRFEWRFHGEIRTLFPVQSPYYLVVYSENKKGFRLNAGFLLQQMDLKIQSLGLGACWLGAAGPKNTTSATNEAANSGFGDSYVIMLAWGKALESPHRTLADFKRKKLEDIMNVPDSRFECCRLAPSSTNSQPWYFEKDGQVWHVYREDLPFVKKLVYTSLNEIDLGIALSHLMVSFDTFTFYPDKEKPKAGYVYMGTVSI